MTSNKNKINFLKLSSSATGAVLFFFATLSYLDSADILNLALISLGYLGWFLFYIMMDHRVRMSLFGDVFDGHVIASKKTKSQPSIKLSTRKEIT